MASLPKYAFIRYCRLGSTCVKSSLPPSRMKRWDTLIGSASMTFPLLNSPFSPVVPPPFPPGTLWRWVAPKSHSARQLGLQHPWTLLTCFNNFLLCEIMQIFQSSFLQSGTLIKSVFWFSWQPLSRLADRPRAGGEGLQPYRLGHGLTYTGGVCRETLLMRWDWSIKRASMWAKEVERWRSDKWRRKENTQQKAVKQLQKRRNAKEGRDLRGCKINKCFPKLT